MSRPLLVDIRYWWISVSLGSSIAGCNCTFKSQLRNPKSFFERSVVKSGTFFTNNLTVWMSTSA